LITESGHIKITDFGGCRPVTKAAKEMIKKSGKNIIQQLRDGDWRENKNKLEDKLDIDACDEGKEEEEEEDDDKRIEGTTAYLPPEVVAGGVPTTAADVWAFGCVLYQCLSGRPPILEENETLTMRKIVTFDLTANDSENGSEEDAFFASSSISSFSTFGPESRALIRRLLSRNPNERPSVPMVTEDSFFSGMDVYGLHRKAAHPLDVGSVAPVADARWSRRQFSSIWAPQPQSYHIDPLDTSNVVSSNGVIDNRPIMEGDEIEVLFLTTNKLSVLNKISEL